MISGGVLKTSPSNGGGGPGIAELDDLPKDWWEVVQNESGGYQYRTVVKILGKQVECMLDGGAGANHIAEELVVSMVEHARKKGVQPDSKDYPILRLEKWVFPEFVHGIASGKPVPLKGSVVLRARLQEGPTPEASKDGPDLSSGEKSQRKAAQIGTESYSEAEPSIAKREAAWASGRDRVSLP